MYGLIKNFRIPPFFYDHTPANFLVFCAVSICRRQQTLKNKDGEKSQILSSF
jgi:hypothetical protein